MPSQQSRDVGVKQVQQQQVDLLYDYYRPGQGGVFMANWATLNVYFV